MQKSFNEQISLVKRLGYRSHGNALRFSYAYLRRAKLATALTFLAVGVSLALPTTFSLFVLNLKQINITQSEANTLTLYLHTQVSDLRGAELAGEIQQLDGIRFTRYVSQDEALEIFRKQFTLADAVDTLDSNPLPGAIIAEMATDDNDEIRIKLLSQRLQDIGEVELVKYDLRWLKRLNAILKLTSRGILIIGVLLVLTALLVVGNTIGLEMQRRTDEISVSHLIGASRKQLRRPFLYSGLIYGLSGGILAIIMVALVMSILNGPAQDITHLYGSNFELKGLTGLHIAFILLISTLIGVFAGWLAVNRHISRIMTQQS